MTSGKHIPIRTCIICGNTRPQRELIRLVYIKGEGVKIDLRKKMPGRGAYVCRAPECLRLEKAERKLERAFRTSLPPGSYEGLVNELKEIADGERK